MPKTKTKTHEISALEVSQIIDNLPSDMKPKQEVLVLEACLRRLLASPEMVPKKGFKRLKKAIHKAS